MCEMLLADMQIVRTRMPNSGIRFPGRLHNGNANLQFYFGSSNEQAIGESDRRTAPFNLRTNADRPHPIECALDLRLR